MKNKRCVQQYDKVVACVSGEKVTYPTGRLVYSPSSSEQGKILLASIKFTGFFTDWATNVLGVCDENGVIHSEGGDGIKGRVTENGDYQLELLGPWNLDQIYVSYNYEYSLV